MINYKRVIKNRTLKLKVLTFFNWIPDRIMIKFQYRLKTGRKLNLKNPKRYTEKLQWYKLYYHNPLMNQCVDKFLVRSFVNSKGLGEILNELYGIYENVEKIPFEKFPNKFVLKTTNGGGGINVILCKNKAELDINETKNLLNVWLNSNQSLAGREWPYYNLKPKIICEKYLDIDFSDNLIDYKFICFAGKVEYVFIILARDSEKGKIFAIYDKDFSLLPYKRLGLRNDVKSIKKPKNWEKMILIAEKLSEDFPHARIDLYNINGDIKFGEITFFHGSGYIKFSPDVFDYILGSKFNLQNYM